MLIHDNIKIIYSREGFLPDYPYHLISDEEMCEAFLRDDGKECYFYDNYPCPDESKLKEFYRELVVQIKYHIDQFLQSKNRNPKLPDWVYSYMIGSTIGPNSDQYDIHDLLVMLNEDNKDDEITIPAYNEIYKVSRKYVRKLTDETREHRPPTIFGEPHVLKILRLEQTDV